MIILLNHFTLNSKIFIKIAKNKKNYFILESSSNDNTLQVKIFDIVKKYLDI